ncbi:MAG TPA: hypothetical protein VF594_10370 [Rubricoccaceae bacterium]|jgi:hypothetical protein
MPVRALLLALLLVTAPSAHAQFVLTTSGATNTQDFAGFLGAGFDQTGGSGRLDSDNLIVRGLSDGNLAFGDTRTVISPADRALAASQKGASTAFSH